MITEERRAYNAAWRAANREKVCARDAARQAVWNAKNPERARVRWASRQATYRAAHPDEVRACLAAWRKAHPDVVRSHCARRRARKAGAAGSHTAAQFRAVCDAHGWRCAYCGRPEPLARDHVVPLSKGGTDYIENIVPACGPCNSRKGSKLL